MQTRENCYVVVGLTSPQQHATRTTRVFEHCFPLQMGTTWHLNTVRRVGPVTTHVNVRPVMVSDMPSQTITIQPPIDLSIQHNHPLCITVASINAFGHPVSERN